MSLGLEGTWMPKQVFEECLEFNAQGFRDEGVG